MRIFLFLVALLWAAPSWGQAAADWNAACDGSSNIVNRVGQGGFACYFFEALGDTSDSAVITCTGVSCAFRFDPDVGTTGTSVAQVWIQQCLDPAVVNDFQCIRIHDVVLDGTVGGAAQRHIVRVGPGQYRVEVISDGGAADNPFVSITGE